MLSPIVSHRLKLFICLLMAASLLGCKEIQVTARKPPIVWMLGLDITTSVPKEHFVCMRDQMIPATVLARLRSRDEVHVMPIDSDPEQRVQVMRLIKNVGMDKEIGTIFEYVQTIKRPDECAESAKGKTNTTGKRPAGCLERSRHLWTNIGGVLAYAKRIGVTLQEERTRVAASGKQVPPAPHVVVNLFTDGKPEGRQSQPPAGPWPAEVVVWFWGVEREHEASLKKWATTEMGLPEAQLHIVRFTDWQTVAEKVFGQHIDRSHPNTEILKRLGVSQTVARR